MNYKIRSPSDIFHTRKLNSVVLKIFDQSRQKQQQKKQTFVLKLETFSQSKQNDFKTCT